MSIVVAVDNGTWAVSVLCVATASCVPHVDIWTIAHRNVVRMKVALYIWRCYLLLIASAQTRCAPNSRQMTSLLELSGEETWGLTVMFWGFAQCWIPSDKCFKVNSRPVELCALWCNYNELLICRILLLNMTGLRRRSAAARLPRLWIRIPSGVWMFVVRVVCCQVEVCATSWSLVHRSPTDCGASLCVIQKPREWGGPGPLGGGWRPKQTNKRGNIIKLKM